MHFSAINETAAASACINSSLKAGVKSEANSRIAGACLLRFPGAVTDCYCKQQPFTILLIYWWEGRNNIMPSIGHESQSFSNKADRIRLIANRSPVTPERVTSPPGRSMSHHDPRSLVIDMNSHLTQNAEQLSSFSHLTRYKHQRETEITSTTMDTKASAGARAGNPQTKRRTNFKNKPDLSYVSMIVMAISSSPHHQLTLSQIYEYMRRKWPEAFDEILNGKYTGWMNSVRHNLSLNDCFVKVPKEAGATGKGHKWTLIEGWRSMFEHKDGSFRRRPRGFRQHLDQRPVSDASQPSSNFEATPVKLTSPHMMESGGLRFSTHVSYNHVYGHAHQNATGEFFCLSACD